MENSLKENAAVLYQDLENWMANLPPKLRTIPFIHLAIPGSHDSMTSSISSHSKLAPDAEKFLQQLKFLGPLLRYVMSRWSKTQGFNVVEQLQAGIRYFDLRVATRKGSIYPYFVHGLYAIEAANVLNKVREFLDAHPMEMVILDFNHFYAFERLDHENFMRFLTGTFAHRLLPYAEHMEHLSLEYMTNKFKYQAIIVYRSNYSRFGQPLLWPSASFPTPWPQTVSEQELLAKLDEGIASRQANVAFVSQCVLTPTNWFVTKHLFSTLRKKCAKPLEKGKLEWIQRQKVGTGGVNIIICDFVDLSSSKFAKEVIGLNAKAYLQENQFRISALTPIA